MTIRPALDGDLPTITEITNHYIAHTAIHFAHAPMTVDELRTTWRADRDTFPWFVVDGADGAPCGYAKAGSFRARAAYRWTTETGIYLAPNVLGRGLGAALYRTLLDELQRRGFHAAIGGIALPNEASVRLHERLGFRHVGTIPEAGWKFERWHDLGFWHLRLAGRGAEGEARGPSGEQQPNG
ncbi:MAG: N-acetyltransferase family protein [Planctomycetota bacterium]